MSSKLQIAPDKTFNWPRPVSVIITRILILISFVPIFLALVISLLRTVSSNPASLLSLRSAVFFSVGFGVVGVFLFYGYRGLGNGDRRGYWLGLLFLVLSTSAVIYKATVTLKNFWLAGPYQSAYEHLPKEFVGVDLTIQVAVVGLLLGLLFKFIFGKQEKMFFSISTSDW